MKTYIISRIGNSLLLEDVNSLGSGLQFEKANIVLAVDFDERHSFMYGLGAAASPCKEWLIDTILAFLGAEDFPLVLIEDSVGSPHDPVFSQGPTAPMWCYHDRVLWPIQREMANVELCTNSLAWAVGGPEVIFFCSPVDLSDLGVIPAKFQVPETLISAIRNNIKYIVVDVLDSEGYVIIPVIRTVPENESRDGRT